jgi:predicted RNase H-like HicB family nuclease
MKDIQNMKDIQIQFEQTNGRWTASVPDLPKVIAYGDTKDIAEVEVRILANHFLKGRIIDGCINITLEGVKEELEEIEKKLFQIHRINSRETLIEKLINDSIVEDELVQCWHQAYTDLLEFEREK